MTGSWRGGWPPGPGSPSPGPGRSRRPAPPGRGRVGGPTGPGRQGGRAGRDHQPAARPVEPAVLPYPQVGAEVGLAEPDPAHGGVGGGDGVRVLHGEGALQERVEGEARGEAGDPVDVSGVCHLGYTETAEAGEGVRTGMSSGVDADVDRDGVDVREQIGRRLQGVRLAVRGDRVLQVDDHDVGAGGQGLADDLGPVAGRVQPGERGVRSGGAARDGRAGPLAGPLTRPRFRTPWVPLIPPPARGGRRSRRG